MNDYDDANAICPFFHKCKGDQIICDGLTGSSISIQKFVDRSGGGLVAKRKEYMATYCSTFNYEECEWARLLNERYQ